MTVLEQHYRAELKRLGARFTESVQRQRWSSFRADLEDLMAKADLVHAASVHRRATGQGLHIVKPVSLDNLWRYNDWTDSHSRSTGPTIRRLIGEMVDREIAFWRTHTPNKERVASRLQRMHRNLVPRVRILAQQTQLSDPYFVEQLPVWEYRSACKATSRATHCAMSRFVAHWTWEGWKIVLPPNGWNCLCWVMYHPRNACIHRGWLKDDRPTFRVHWPNSAARRNYESGDFPDPGWDDPKPHVRGVLTGVLG
jgi:hypothetical protein